MSSQKDKGQKKKKVIYSEDFQAMLEKLEEEDNADTSKNLMKKSRLCLDKVKALEKHFEMENRLQPERKVRIAEEVGLEPRQVAIWFQNRRARWRTKQLEKEYDHLRANYDALKHDYGSLEQEKAALLAQLKDLKAKIKSRNSDHDMNASPSSVPATVHSSNATNESTSNMDVPSSCTSFDPFAMSMDGLQLCRAYQDHLMKMEEMNVIHNFNEIPGNNNFFSIDQAPTMHHWYNNDQFNW